MLTNYTDIDLTSSTGTTCASYTTADEGQLAYVAASCCTSGKHLCEYFPICYNDDWLGNDYAPSGWTGGVKCEQQLTQTLTNYAAITLTTADCSYPSRMTQLEYVATSCCTSGQVFCPTPAPTPSPEVDNASSSIAPMALITALLVCAVSVLNLPGH